MGGDRNSPLNTSTVEESSLEQELQEHSLRLPTYLRDGEDSLGAEVEDYSVQSLLDFGGFDDARLRGCSNPLDFEPNQRRIGSVYGDVLRSYDELRRRSESLEEAKTKILSYTPGAWIENAGGMKLGDYNVPKTSSLLLIGPKGSGKSSLVNRISRVFEVDKFASERAQISYNSSVGDGTYFLQEYMIPRGSTSFCLYDTRSLSNDSSENMKMLKRWMTKGVRHGEMVIRDSDSSSLKTRIKCKARQNGYRSREIRMVNFVIFVVNGLSVLKSMEVSVLKSEDSNNKAETQYTQLIATMFNCPFLSFKDDKPVIVLTHGDLLSLSDRARIRVHLGELLGVPPNKQIFDIPENYDPATELTIVDMLRYSLEHADRNLPDKGWFMDKVCIASLPACLLLLILGIAIVLARVHGAYSYRAPRTHHAPRPSTHRDWHTFRHLWLGSDYD